MHKDGAAGASGGSGGKGGQTTAGASGSTAGGGGGGAMAGGGGAADIGGQGGGGTGGAGGVTTDGSMPDAPADTIPDAPTTNGDAKDGGAGDTPAGDATDVAGSDVTGDATDGGDAGVPFFGTPTTIEHPSGAAAPTPFCVASWCWQNPLPFDLTGSAVSGTSATDVWAAGDGFIAHWDGQSWTESTGDLRHFWVDVLAITATDAWAIAKQGYAAHWNGTRWTETSPPNPASIDLNRLWGTGTNDVWAVGDNGTYHWTGAGWQTVNTGIGASVAAIGGSSSSDIWVAYAGSGMHHWNGTAWSNDTSSTAFADILNIYAASPTDAWATSRTQLIHWNGTAWSLVHKATGYEIFGRVTGTSASDVWVIGGPGVAHWNGTAWSSWAPQYRYAYTVVAFGPSDALLSGDDGYMARWNGTTWTEVTAGAAHVSEHFVSVWASGATNAWLAAEGGDVYRFDGAQLTRQNATIPALALWGSAASDSVGRRRGRRLALDGHGVVGRGPHGQVFLRRVGLERHRRLGGRPGRRHRALERHLVVAGDERHDEQPQRRVRHERDRRLVRR